MVIDEVCPDCGAERASWDGGSHRKVWVFTGERDQLLCRDGRGPDGYFQSWHPSLFEALGSDRWPM